MRRVLVALVALAVASQVCFADKVVLRDGRSFTGRIVERTDAQVVFEVQKYGGKMKYKMTFARADIASLTEGAVKEEPPKPDAAAKGGPLSLPAEPKCPPIVSHNGPTYYVVPLKGVVGETVVASVLEKSFADAVNRKPTVVILVIDSPGGSVGEVDKILEVIRSHARKLRLVVYVRNSALSAAAITAMAVKEVYMHPSGIIGAATAFEIAPTGVPREIAEKFQSVWRATARSCAEAGGHESLLAEAMVDKGMQLWVSVQDGRKIISERAGGPDARMITRRGKLLTMTASEAVDCGLALGVAEDYEKLRELLKIDSWTECEGHAKALLEHREAVIKAVTAEFERLRERFLDAMRQAEATNPVNFTYMFDSQTGQLTPESQKKWQQHSVTCLRFLERAEDSVRKAGGLGREYPELLAGDPDFLRRIENAIKSMRETIARRAYRKSVTE